MRISAIAIVVLLSLSACSKSSDTTNQISGDNPTQATTKTTFESPNQKSKNLKEAELADGEQIARAASLVTKGMEKKEAEWQARAQAATSNAQLQAIVFEQRQFFEQVKQQLETVQPQTVRGKQMHQQMLNGLNGAISGFYKLANYDFTNPSHEAQILAITKESYDSIMMFISGVKQLQVVGQEHGRYSEKEQQKIDKQFAALNKKKEEFDNIIKSVD